MNLKVDRTSMANSLEVRSPFIDHRLIEYLLSRRTDSLEYKKPKLYVKQYLSQDFDENFLNRKKMGFVFDLENLIYENKEKITTLINESGLHQFIPKLNIKKLFIRKSRINSQRIYKLLILTHFIKNN
jgi:asparagine synthase (glutamine-hydrolysing)